MSLFRAANYNTVAQFLSNIFLTAHNYQSYVNKVIGIVFLYKMEILLTKNGAVIKSEMSYCS